MRGNLLKEKIVLITGGTGSFGRNYVKHILRNSPPKKLIIFSRDEFKQHLLKEELVSEDLIERSSVRFFIGDVRDLSRLLRAFHGVDIVVHAAALKQVPALEYNPYEAIKTNVIGSQNVIEAAVDCKVKKVLLISTDKAAEPVSLYGASKLCAERLVVSANAYTGRRTAFSAVRYGNVVGSRGSIVEILLSKKNVDIVHVTHEEMTRFWISLEQSFELVNFAIENMVGGEIFVPKIPSMKLIDLFDALAPKAKKKIVGIRPGEKIHEMLISEEESRHSVELSKYYVVLPNNPETFDVESIKKRYMKMGGKETKTGFSLESHTNELWINKEDFAKMLGSGKKTN